MDGKLGTHELVERDLLLIFLPQKPYSQNNAISHHLGGGAALAVCTSEHLILLTDRQKTNTWMGRFFFQFSLLPPYLLCSQRIWQVYP